MLTSYKTLGKVLIFDVTEKKTSDIAYFQYLQHFDFWLLQDIFNDLGLYWRR